MAYLPRARDSPIHQNWLREVLVRGALKDWVPNVSHRPKTAALSGSNGRPRDADHQIYYRSPGRIRSFYFSTSLLWYRPGSSVLFPTITILAVTRFGGVSPRPATPPTGCGFIAKSRKQPTHTTVVFLPLEMALVTIADNLGEYKRGTYAVFLYAYEVKNRTPFRTKQNRCLEYPNMHMIEHPSSPTPCQPDSSARASCRCCQTHVTDKIRLNGTLPY
ncbi:hypothetical protein F4804DRAFT_187983 [Jackrogersella minutella]|nr:hypothetical protein F4804DRAFT_187983 [Jackrogersella minutella]